MKYCTVNQLVVMVKEISYVLFWCFNLGCIKGLLGHPRILNINLKNKDHVANMLATITFFEVCVHLLNLSPIHSSLPALFLILTKSLVVNIC